MNKTYGSASEAVADIGDGVSMAVGGFGLVGVPVILIRAILAQGATDLRVVSNNCGVDDWGLGELLSAGRISRVTASYIGENADFARRYLGGDLEVELTPQGSLAERMRAGGAGIPAFYTPSGVGTMVSEGGLPWRYSSTGEVIVQSPKKETRIFGSLGEEQEYVLEEAIVTDFALVRAKLGDTHGNLVFEKSARNFNPPAAMAGRITIAEVEELVPAGSIDPDDVHLPGIFVDRIVQLSAPEAADLPIEKTTVRPKPMSSSPKEG